MVTMTQNNKLDWPHIESALHKLEKPEFIELLQQLSEVSAEAANFLTARFHGEKTREEILAPYRAIIAESFFPPDETIPDDLDFTESRKAIANYRQATNDTLGVLDLLLYLAEIVVASVGAHGGPYYGPHYDDLRETLSDFTNLLWKNGSLYPQFADRIRKFRERADAVTLSFGDYAIDDLYDMEINLGPEES